MLYVGVTSLTYFNTLALTKLLDKNHSRIFNILKIIKIFFLSWKVNYDMSTLMTEVTFFTWVGHYLLKCKQELNRPMIFH